MKKIYLSSIVLFFILIFLGGLFFEKSEAQEETGEILKKVKVIEIKKGELSNVQEYSGIVKGIQETDLASKISGRIISVFKEEGDVVKKGELLAVIDGSEFFDQKNLSAQQLKNSQKSFEETKDYYDQLVDQSKKELDLAEDSYDEAKNGGERDKISEADKNVEKAKEVVESTKRMRDMQKQLAENQINISESQLVVSAKMADNTRIVAPYTGVITRKYFDAGAIISPQNPILKIVDLSEKEIETMLPGKVAEKISVEKEVQLKNQSGEIFFGKIRAISPVSDNVTRKSLIKILLENSEDIRLGDLMMVDLEVENKKEAILIPLSSVRKDYYEDVVFIFKNGLAEKRIVNLGFVENGKAEVLSGIDEGDFIIIEGQSYLKNNEEVKIYE